LGYAELAQRIHAKLSSAPLDDDVKGLAAARW